jgi:hypothetical protein
MKFYNLYAYCAWAQIFHFLFRRRCRALPQSGDVPKIEAKDKERPPWKKALLIGIGYTSDDSPHDVLVGAPRDVVRMRKILIGGFCIHLLS